MVRTFIIKQHSSPAFTGSCLNHQSKLYHHQQTCTLALFTGRREAASTKMMNDSYAIEGVHTIKTFHQPRKAAPVLTPSALSTWLRENYSEERGAIIPKATMYEDYEEFCKRAKLRPKSPNVFGKVVKQFYPSVGCSRIGSQKNQRAYYTGIAANIHKPHSDPPSSQPIVNKTTSTFVFISPWPTFNQTNIIPIPPSADEDLICRLKEKFLSFQPMRYS